MKYMHKVTVDELVANIHSRWLEQYPEDKPHIAQALEVLAPPTKDEIDRIIGNSSWTRLACEECERDVERLVYVGETITYEQSPVGLCADCLDAAVKLMVSE
jgi:hypothetical protein